MLKRVAVFASGAGSNFAALLQAKNAGEITADFPLLIASNKTAPAIQRALDNGMAVRILDKTCENRADEIIKALREYSIDYCVLAGYLPIVPPEVIRAYPNRIVNIHPSLIPAFCGQGFYGHFVHEAAIARGVKLSGATVHFVDEGTDTGPIILQEAVTVENHETPASLAAKILQVEHRILPRAIALLCAGQVELHNGQVHILPANK